MGNTPSSTSSRTHDETVDYGALVPQGVYTGPRDWSHAAVAQSIIERRLAPFYRPLEDYEEGWTDEQILSARKEPPPPPAQDEEDGNGSAAGSSHGHAAQGQAQGGGGSHIGLGFGHGHSGQGSSLGGRHHGKKVSTTGKGKDRDTAAAAAAQAALNEASLYRGAAECPICFLYYPPNINYSRCCSQPICTECFVQIKRAEPDAQHLESEPAACPYCVRSDFGVVYKPPPWRAGIGSDGHLPPSPGAVQAPVSPPTEIKRRQSFGANDPQVVTTDQIRPDWEAKLAAVKAAVARRAARRIIMRQVGDRLIPVGISSGRVQIMPEEGGGAAGATGQPEDRRQRRRDRDISRMLGIPGFNSGDYPGGVIATQDLEELMIAEAMRQSVIEEEERQRKEREKEMKEKKKGGNSTPTTATTDNSAGPSTSTATSPIEGLPSSAPHSTMHLPAVQGSSLLPPPGPGPETRGRQASGHQASTSLSNSNTLAPNTGSGDSTPTTSSSRARSQPPFSALSAALRGAAHAASAIGVPGAHKKRERDLTSTASSSQSNINTKERQSSSGPSSARPSLSAQGSGGSGTNAPPAPTSQRTSPPVPAPVLVPTSPADTTASSRVLELETTANTNTTSAAEPSASSTPPPASSPSTTAAPVSMLSVSIPPESGPQSAITPASSSAAPISSVSSAPTVPDTAAMGLFSPRPELGTNDSFASSIASDASDATVMYDVLGSDEEDGDDGEEEEGLLRGEAPLPVATPGNEPETPGLGGDEVHAGGILGAR